MNEIVTKSRQVDELAAEVAGASNEQIQGITQINNAVGQMDEVTQANAASAEESAAAAEELNQQAETMKASVAELLNLIGSDHQAGSAGVSSRSAPSQRHEPFFPAVSKPRQNGHAGTLRLPGGRW